VRCTHSLFRCCCISPSQILVRAYAPSINPIDWKLLQGNISLVKPFSFSHTPGYDVARIVVDIGSEVRRFQIDDKVFGSIGINGGTFVGYVCGEKSMFTLKPNNFSMLEAPAIADSCPISYQVLFQKPAPAMGSGSKVFVC
jgi:NADPH:quinone reductase-like Zn-dependent oxidoreductase